MKLTTQQANIIRLVDRSPDHGDGWRQLSPHWQTILLQFNLGDLIEIDGDKARLTVKGKAVLEWAT